MINGIWIPAVAKYPIAGSPDYMIRVYPGYPNNQGGSWHSSKLVNWKLPEASVSKFISKFFMDFPSRGLI